MDEKTKEQCTAIGGLSALSLIGGLYTGHWQNIALAVMGGLIIAMIVYLNRHQILKQADEVQDSKLGPRPE